MTLFRKVNHLLTVAVSTASFINGGGQLLSIQPVTKTNNDVFDARARGVQMKSGKTKHEYYTNITRNVYNRLEEQPVQGMRTKNKVRSDQNTTRTRKTAKGKKRSNRRSMGRPATTTDVMKPTDKIKSTDVESSTDDKPDQIQSMTFTQRTKLEPIDEAPELLQCSNENIVYPQGDLFSAMVASDNEQPADVGSRTVYDRFIKPIATVRPRIPEQSAGIEPEQQMAEEANDDPGLNSDWSDESWGSSGESSDDETSYSDKPRTITDRFVSSSFGSPKQIIAVDRFVGTKKNDSPNGDSCSTNKWESIPLSYIAKGLLQQAATGLVNSQCI